jgi:hypothetical protein
VARTAYLSLLLLSLLLLLLLLRKLLLLLLLPRHRLLYHGASQPAAPAAPVVEEPQGQRGSNIRPNAESPKLIGLMAEHVCTMHKEQIGITMHTTARYKHNGTCNMLPAPPHDFHTAMNLF